VVNQLISQSTQFSPELRISAIFPHLSEITTPEPLGEQGCVNTCWKANEVTYNFGIVPFPLDPSRTMSESTFMITASSKQILPET
jgi:hypothetical protein